MQREQFIQLCRSVYEYFSADPEAYANTVASLADADPDRFSLVLQNETKKLVEDISAGGVPEVVAHDYADFLVEYFGGDWGGMKTFLNRLALNERSGEIAKPSFTRGDKNSEAIGIDMSGPLWETLPRALGIAKSRGDEGLLNQVSLLDSQWEQLQIDHGSGFITREDAYKRELQIIATLKNLFE